MAHDRLDAESRQEEALREAAAGPAPRPLVFSTPARSAYRQAVQRRAQGPLPPARSVAELTGPQHDDRGGDVQEAAARGTAGPGGRLPFADTIQPLFGRHDLSGVQAHTDGAAAEASAAMGAHAFAAGDHVGFAGAPDLHTAAHEAAHVVQQRAGVQLSGGVGQQGDRYERHADAVADAVVSGRPAEPLLAEFAPASASATAGVQHKTDKGKGTTPTLRRGSTGPAVKKLQEALNARGAEPPLKVDGIFGPKTEAAVRAFQEQNGLAPDGVAGPDTWGALGAAAATPDIEATEEALGEHAAEKMDAANLDPHTLDQGIQYDYNYEDLCRQSGRMDLWKEDYRSGFADPTYFVRTGFMDWRLKPRMSASAALKSWLRGLTVAECNSTLVAIEIDSLRAAIGDQKFDESYGSPDQDVPEAQRLRIKPGTDGTPVDSMMVQTEVSKLKAEKDKKGEAFTDAELTSALKVGEWYYFYNHPKYLLKHPGGAWQGENALYMGLDDAGNRLWSGLGAQRVTEDQMFDEMIDDYKRPRDRRDEETMVSMGAKNADGSYADPRYDPASGEFADEVSKDQILNDPAYKIGDTTRKGGFQFDSGTKLDVGKVKAKREAP